MTMENFIVAYRDPLFGVILFFAIVAVVALASIVWARMRTADEEKQIGTFLSGFEFAAGHEGFDTFLDENRGAVAPLLLLAQAYEKSGEYEKAVKIVLSILSNGKAGFSAGRKSELLERLGRYYFKAGFLFKSRNILLEAVNLSPRQSQALLYLSSVYLSLREYDRGLEVLDALREQGVETGDAEVIFQAMKIADSVTLSAHERLERLARMAPRHPAVRRLAVETAFAADPAAGWRLIGDGAIDAVIDLLWYLDEGKLDLDIIKTHPALAELFAARGVVGGIERGSRFETDVLIALRTKAGDTRGADLGFEYLCRSCKHVLPLYFVRCPHCLSLGSCEIETVLVRESEGIRYE